jgi:hypothetical protein
MAACYIHKYPSPVNQFNWYSNINTDLFSKQKISNSIAGHYKIPFICEKKKMINSIVGPYRAIYKYPCYSG